MKTSLIVMAVAFAVWLVTLVFPLGGLNGLSIIVGNSAVITLIVLALGQRD